MGGDLPDQQPTSPLKFQAQPRNSASNLPGFGNRTDIPTSKLKATSGNPGRSDCLRICDNNSYGISGRRCKVDTPGRPALSKLGPITQNLALANTNASRSIKGGGLTTGCATHGLRQETKNKKQRTVDCSMSVTCADKQASANFDSRVICN